MQNPCAKPLPRTMICRTLAHNPLPVPRKTLTDQHHYRLQGSAPALPTAFCSSRAVTRSASAPGSPQSLRFKVKGRWSMLCLSLAHKRRQRQPKHYQQTLEGLPVACVTACPAHKALRSGLHSTNPQTFRLKG